jgi:hypothetical protein
LNIILSIVVSDKFNNVFDDWDHYEMWFKFIRITRVIIDHYFLNIIKIFDWISFAIWRMFHSADFVLQSFVVVTFDQFEINNILHIIFFFLIDDNWRWWWNDLFWMWVIKVFSKQKNVKNRIYVHFVWKIQFKREAHFLQNIE